MKDNVALRCLLQAPAFCGLNGVDSHNLVLAFSDKLSSEFVGINLLGDLGSTSQHSSRKSTSPPNATIEYVPQDEAIGMTQPVDNEIDRLRQQLRCRTTDRNTNRTSGSC